MEKINQKFFAKNVLISTIPVIIVIAILGSFSIVITERYVKDEINKNNIMILKQNSENIELMLDEMDQVYLTFGINTDVTLHLKRILNTSAYSFEDTLQLNIIKSLLNATSYSKPYIQSIYIYFNNPNGNFITTSEGMVSLNNYFDKSWFDAFKNMPRNVSLWTEVRNLKLYACEQKPVEVLTVYKRIGSLYTNKSDGVLVLNIYLDYIKDFINSAITIPGQKILLIDRNDNLICQSDDGNFVSGEDIRQYEGNNIISELKSEEYDIRYISIVPKAYLYRIPLKLLDITLFLLVFSSVTIILLTYHTTKKNYANIRNIISIIDSANNNSTFPNLPTEYKDEYSYITYNILKNFMEQNYLKVQLSEKKYKMQAMELLALQSQINPHFLFNTLETIYLKVLAFTGKPNEATKMIEDLSQILKYSLSNPSETITLKEELENTMCYIDILKMRYKDKFNIIWQYDNSLLCCRVMKLMFQPLIENAVYHGIKEKDGTSTIKIRIDKYNTEMRIAVIDNGIGISKEKLKQIKESLKKEFDYSEHIGLLNINERLKLIYGNNYSITIRSKFGMGTAIYIKFPLWIKDK
ncbi:sensor histidine kinase [Mahella sp.]|uniref:cache domain-containing sensor histidine kinase n=1 Tax=Mahella sp. TaxID=2798721 RepID=UPI0025BE62DA|nr:sensor histidine kinase [Mahella sp.]MBZ4664904.1 putative signal transduction histidine kinase [Mahella sp.]